MTAHLGGMTVQELLGRIDAREVAEWQAYETVFGPLGGARDDFLTAVVATTLANVNRAKSAKPAKICDFIPTWDTGRRQSWQEQLSIVQQLNSAHGGSEA